MNSAKQGSGARRVFGRSSLIIAAAAAAVGLAACGSSGGSGASAGGSGSSPTSAASGSIPADLASFYPGHKATGTPVKIGVVSDEGGGAESNSNYADAAVAAADYANAELGGIGGHPIVIDRCGTKSTAAGAIACANQFVSDKVVAVDSAATGFGANVVPIITKAGIPYVTAQGEAAAELTTPNAFSWSGGFAADLRGFANYAKSQGWKSVTIFPVDVPSAAGAVQALGGPFFKAAGVKLTITPIPGGIADATPEVTAGLESKPAAVAIVNDEAGCTTTLQALQIVDPGIPTMVNSSCYNTGTLGALGSAMNGDKVMTDSSISTSDPEAQLYRRVMATYQPKADPTGYTFNGYQGMLGLVRAVAAGGITSDVTTTTISTAIKAAKNVPLPVAAGLITFTCDGTALPGLPAACTAEDLVLTIKNGVAVDPVLTK